MLPFLKPKDEEILQCPMFGGKVDKSWDFL